MKKSNNFDFSIMRFLLSNISWCFCKNCSKI